MGANSAPGLRFGLRPVAAVIAATNYCTRFTGGAAHLPLVASSLGQ